MVHNPDLVLVYESGMIGAEPRRIPLSIGDGEVATTGAATDAERSALRELLARG